MSFKNNNGKRILAIIMLILSMSFIFADNSGIKLNFDDKVEVEEGENLKVIDHTSYIISDEMANLFKLEKTVEDGVLKFKGASFEIVYTPDGGFLIKDNDTIGLEGYKIINNNYYLPLKSVAEILGFGVTWDDANNLIHVMADGVIKEIEVKPVSRYAIYNFTEEDVLWLARICDVEARDGSVNKKIAVANVVLNRVRSERFPNTIKEVIFQKGQFPPSKRASFTTFTPCDESFEAAYRAIAGENNVDECLFFNMVPFPTKSKSDFFGNIEGDYFYY